MESTATTNAESSPVQSKRLVRFCTRGVSFGVLSYLVGYILIACVFVVGPASIKAHLDVKLKWFGFIFYNAQFVPISVSNQSYNYITQATNPAVPAFVYQAIPILSLAVVSAVFTIHNQLDSLVETVVYSGASVAVGYTVLSIIGSFLFTVTSRGITAQPNLMKAAAIGAAYPIVIATVVTFVVAFIRR